VPQSSLPHSPCFCYQFHVVTSTGFEREPFSPWWNLVCPHQRKRLVPCWSASQLLAGSLAFSRSRLSHTTSDISTTDWSTNLWWVSPVCSARHLLTIRAGWLPLVRPSARLIQQKPYISFRVNQFIYVVFLGVSLYHYTVTYADVLLFLLYSTDWTTKSAIMAILPISWPLQLFGRFTKLLEDAID
jgi:hypothetical protein